MKCFAFASLIVSTAALDAASQFAQFKATHGRTYATPEEEAARFAIFRQTLASIDEMNESLGGYFFYSLYDDCIYDEPYRRRRLDEIDDPVDRELIALTMSEGRGGLNDYPCAGTVMSDWLDRPEVRAALNIQPDNRFNNAVRGKCHGFCAFFLTKL